LVDPGDGLGASAGVLQQSAGDIADAPDVETGSATAAIGGALSDIDADDAVAGLGLTSSTAIGAAEVGEGAEIANAAVAVRAASAGSAGDDAESVDAAAGALENCEVEVSDAADQVLGAARGPMTVSRQRMGRVECCRRTGSVACTARAGDRAWTGTGTTLGASLARGHGCEGGEGPMIIWPAKDPAATENFAFNFAAALGSEQISTQLVVADGATVSGATIEGTSVPFELSGGTAGTVAKVTCTATLSDGRILVEVGVLPIGGEPISLADAKTALVIERDDEDAVLAGYLRAAVGHIERATGKKLTPKIVAQTLDGFPLKPCDPRHPRGPLPIWLLHGPASEVLSIDYDDPDGVAQSLTSFRLVPGTQR
jgi:hypothetical protein